MHDILYCSMHRIRSKMIKRLVKNIEHLFLKLTCMYSFEIPWLDDGYDAIPSRNPPAKPLATTTLFWTNLPPWKTTETILKTATSYSFLVFGN